ncbi:NAD(+) diphosphatase [Microcella daejeonensis]|uniref:NAD(+) diphosphatase n=1 Tax=Microcella daejeonensis TaxID=2994971 RepID=UPI00226F1827|nr:NAD(+) diphosphatase [Microcella daejeonensis]WAB82843.1 NAD(+) diphosphatase [Microcella daejeonensis]
MHRSITARLPLSRYRIDRDDTARLRPDLFAELAAEPSSRVLPVWRGEVLLTTAEHPALALLPADAVPTDVLRIYLGRTTEAEADLPAGAAIIAAVLDDAAGERMARDVTRWGNPRTLGHQLSDRDAGLAVEALAIANWHAGHAFSPRTGNATTPGRAGWVRVDVETGREMFPRTDAAIIVGVTDERDRLVLGSNAAWESNRFSLLAGFVEPGESLEAAVAREVAEESGLRVVDPVYVGSQPWPFPASLMLGFRATLDPAVTAELRPDGDEILDLRWFSRDELRSQLDTIVLPGRTSIARAIIEDWYGGPLEA